MKILVSACLLGCNCRYDSKTQNKNLKNYLPGNYCIIPFCPEQAGGLSTPRIPCEIIDNQVINKVGEDKTKEFLKGAEETLNICKLLNIKTAILKSKSPSCGFGEIYDGSFSNKIINGNGITSDLLFKNSIKIYNENNFIDFFISSI